MMRNEQAILKMKAHLHMIYGLASDLNGEYGIAKKLMRQYGNAFNEISTVLLPQMGMTNDEIVDLVTSIDNDLEVFGDTLPGA
jgi:myosin-crossreactive antigen